MCFGNLHGNHFYDLDESVNVAQHLSSTLHAKSVLESDSLQNIDISDVENDDVTFENVLDLNEQRIMSNFTSIEAYEIVDSDPDGHCFIHSVISSLKNQLGVRYNHMDMLDMIKRETTGNKLKYTPLTSFEEY